MLLHNVCSAAEGCEMPKFAHLAERVPCPQCGGDLACIHHPPSDQSISNEHTVKAGANSSPEPPVFQMAGTPSGRDE